jgi:glycosyltransferase involved in cell wall biosynthesis
MSINQEKNRTMRVSIITPTYQREAYLPYLYKCFQAQTYPDLEMIILDDSPSPSRFFHPSYFSDSRVRYLRSEERIPTSEKINMLCQEAQGEIIVNFDDDDYYAPQYVERMVAELGDNDLITLSAWYILSPRHKFLAYLDVDSKVQLFFRIAPGKGVSVDPHLRISKEVMERYRWGYGFTHVFRKSLLEHTQFPQIDFGYDYEFVNLIKSKGARLITIPDREGLVVHMIHGTNLSTSFAQYPIPLFLLQRFFGKALNPYMTDKNLF